MAHIDEFTLNEYLDEALSEAERNEVAGHLAHCAACQAAFTELQQLFFTLATVPDIPLSVDIGQTVVAQIEREKGVDSDRWTVSSGLLLLFELAATAVLLFWLWPVVQEWLLAARNWQTRLVVNITWPQPISWAEINEAVTAVTRQLQTTAFSDLAAIQWAMLIGLALIIWLAGNRLIFTNNAR